MRLNRASWFLQTFTTGFQRCGKVGKVAIGTQAPEESRFIEFPMNTLVCITEYDAHPALPEHLYHFLKSLQTGQIHEWHAQQPYDEHLGHVAGTDEPSLHSLRGPKEKGTFD